MPRGTLLAGKLEVQSRLGRGTFGVVYKVVDTLGDVTRALKLILRDRHEQLVATLETVANTKSRPVTWHALWRLPPGMASEESGMRYPAVSFVASVAAAAR